MVLAAASGFDSACLLDDVANHRDASAVGLGGAWEYAGLRQMLKTITNSVTAGPKKRMAGPLDLEPFLRAWN